MLKKIIKKYFPPIIVKQLKLFYAVLMWKTLKIDKSPRHPIKEYWIRYFQKRYKINILIETGTYYGAMIQAMKSKFKQIYSIELGENLAQKAQQKFAKYAHIKIIQGDTIQILPKILTSISEPCLFWLDAHYSGGITAKGDKETPILQELQHVFNHQIKNHIILIDDARLFTGKNNYPHFKQLSSFIKKNNAKLTVVIKDDIIRTYQK